MNLTPSTLLWPVDRLPEALEQMTERAGYGTPHGQWPGPDASAEPSRAWMGALASRLGVELEPVVPLYGELPLVLRTAAPALLQVRRGERPHYLALLGRRGTEVRLLTIEGQLVWEEASALLALLREEAEAATAPEIDALLESIETSPRQRARLRGQLLHQRLATRPLQISWILRPLPTARRAVLWGNLPLLGAGILLNHTLLSLVLAGSFWMIGRAALQAHLEPGWFQGWIVIIACSIPLRLLEVWWQGLFSMRLGGLLKQQLLAAVLKLTPDEIRLDGVGRHFGRVVESEVVELLTLGGGLLAVLSVVDLFLAGLVLFRGAGGIWHLGALAGWTLVAVALTWRHYSVQRRWSAQRIDLTDGLLERMIGHRTRLAQLPLEQWHDGEDAQLHDYHETSRALDARTMQLTTLLPGGWLVLALLTLLPAFAAGRATAADLAIAVGGVVLAQRAFDEIGFYFQQLSLVATSMTQIRPLLAAIDRPELTSQVPLELETERRGDVATDAGTLLDARGLTFRHRSRSRAVLENCSLKVAHGDRILLEGPSGGGKSTLVSLLTGLRSPDAGVLLLRGLDRVTFGLSGWRKRVAAAPQFHENHILAGSFGYNLLLGRDWPVSPAVLEEAKSVCRELGLDELIAKMPSGLDEMIGETGWQLSHGEKSRLYIARTLLQRVELVILDESFASLDPETMGVAVRCVLEHAPSVLVVSHP